MKITSAATVTNTVTNNTSARATATPRKPSHQEMFWQMVQEDIGYVRAGYSMDLPGTFPPGRPGTVQCGAGESFSGKEILLARDIARMMSGGPQCQPCHFYRRHRSLQDQMVAAYTINISIVTARFSVKA